MHLIIIFIPTQIIEHYNFYMSRHSSLANLESFAICRALVFEIVDVSASQSESAQFYRLEIEKCQEYIRTVQLQATHTWNAPIKPDDFDSLEDNDFFISGPPLKVKLAIIQDQKKVEQSHRVSIHTRNNSIRISGRPRISYALSWSEQKYKEVKQKADVRKASRQASLQKLVASRKTIEPTCSEKQLRAAFTQGKSKLQLQKSKQHHLAFRHRSAVNNEERESIPMLVELAYKITQDNSKPDSDKPVKKMKENAQFKTNKCSEVNKALGRLKINSYNPSLNQIKVTNWIKFNEILGNDEARKHEAFENIRYFTDL